MTASCASMRSSLETMNRDCRENVCARVKLKDNIASVHLDIPKVLLGDRDSFDLRFPVGLLGEDFLRSVELDSGDPWPNVFAVTGRGVSIDYEVKVAARLGVPADEVREWSFQHERGWHLKGYQLIPEVRLDAPALIA